MPSCPLKLSTVTKSSRMNEKESEINWLRNSKMDSKEPKIHSEIVKRFGLSTDEYMDVYEYYQVWN